MICDALSLAGYKTLSAGDGLEALNLLRSNSVDLIVSDINMPKVDGLQLLEGLRMKGDETPFVLLTASKERPHLSTGFKLGADDFIAKPIEPASLWRVLRRFLVPAAGDALPHRPHWRQRRRADERAIGARAAE